VQNWLGRFGASLAQPLYMIGGSATWGISMALIVWGARFATHSGTDRALGRVVFVPIAIAMASVYAATLSPSADWPHSFGMGGLFGDTVLSVLLTILPLGAAFGVKVLSLAAFVATLALSAFVLGFTRQEIGHFWRRFVFGLVVAYDLILKVLGQSAQVSLKAAHGVQSRVQSEIEARREVARAERAMLDAELAAERAIPAPRVQSATERAAAVVRANPAMPTGRPPAATPPQMSAPRRGPVDEPAEPMAPRRAMPQAAPMAAPLVAPARPTEAPATGFLARMPSLLKRAEPAQRPMPEPELVERDVWTGEAGPMDGDRIKARISDAIRNRSRSAAPARVEPQMERRQGPRPLILDLGPKPATLPPMTAPTISSVRVAPPPPPDLIDMDEDDDFAGENMFIEEDSWTVTPPVTAAAPLLGPAPALRAAEPRKAVIQHVAKRPIQPSTRAKAEAQPALPLEDKFANYEHPPLSLLTSPSEIERHHLSDEALEENARMLESVLDDYGVKGEIVSVRPGPVVTMYELEPAPGLKASRVIGLSDDIARSMSALSARVSTVPGRSVIGIELPNEKREMVVLREILSARDFGDSQMRLPLALGKDIGGEPIIANLAKMPHLLIAGTTGSGKSVAINTMILSLLYKLTPEECRLIMIDPKMLELSVYDGIPHLLSPVVTDPKKAVVALKWVVGEMEERYRKMSKMGVRNIEGYNGRVREALAKGETFDRTIQTGFDEETGDPIFETDTITPVVLPYIVVVVDEMADLMMVAGKEIEACIQRLAQMARASGIHLIMATQRPSVDVITGTIKANFPTRISFQVTSKIDSRTILGEMGAEQLLGMGDMLYMAGGGKISRIHGPFCSDEEVEEIVNFLKGFGPPDYMSGVVDGPDEATESSIDAVLGLGTGDEAENALYDMAVQIVAKDRKCSTSYIQRKLAIGYNKAARLVEQMEDEGVVTPANHVGKREILVPEPH
jgi:DNA segregation ATPase FtsK/SpoIIIE, S-DNA-T family